MIAVRVIENLDQFAGLSSAWDDLLANTAVDHAFMKHIWFTEWIKAYGCSDKLAVVTIWSDSQLVAAAPLRRTQLQFRGIKSRGLSFLWSPLSPRCNLIAERSDYIRPLVENILALPNWDVFVAKNMELELEVTARFAETLRECKADGSFQIEDGLQSPYMFTQGSFEDYWNSLPDKRRKHLERMSVKRLEKAGDYEISSVRSSKQFQEFMPAMFEISRRSWKSASDDHLQISDPEGRFYSSFTSAGIDLGLVALYTISIEGKLAGFEYLLSFNNRYSLIRCDYDEDFKYYAPGNNLRLAILRDLFGKEAVCEYDLGGDAYPYKLEWCDRIRSHVTMTIAGNSLLGRAIMVAKNKIMPSLRKLGIEIPGRRKRH